MKTKTYYQGMNTNLLRSVPQYAQSILEVGCGEGYLGRALKELNPNRTVIGLEYVPEIAAIAAQHLDKVINIDIEKEKVPIEKNTFDCILYGDILEHLIEPLHVLKQHKSIFQN